MLLVMVLLMGVSSMWAQTPEEMFSKGKSYYKDGDYTQAVHWYRKAAEQGYADAQCCLGVCYINGHGVTQDYPQAVESGGARLRNKGMPRRKRESRVF